MERRELGTCTWTEFDPTEFGPRGSDRPVLDRPVLVVPVGSCEQHGPHLPLHTDTVVATELGRELVARRTGCVLAPALTVTASGEHQGFPGTLSIGTAVMTDVVIELVRSADWAAGVVLVNGHGGNVTAVRRAAEVADREHRRLLAWWPHLPDGDLHAGHTETSLMLALAPDQVRLDAAVAGPHPSLDDLVRHGVRPLSPSGVLGDPTGATAEAGRAIFERLASELVHAVDAWGRG